MKREEIARNLQNSVLFAEATQAELESYAEVARVEVIPEGQYVYKQGDPSEVFYVIAVGDAELVFDQGSGGTRIVARVGSGGHFGETGILTNKPHSLSIRALSDLVVICFDKRFFRTALLANGKIHRQLDAALAERLRVAFLDQVDSAGAEQPPDSGSSADEVILFKEKNPTARELRRIAKRKNEDFRESKTGRRTQEIIERFAGDSRPFLLTGESGTGKLIIARQVHNLSSRAGAHYKEINLKEFEAHLLDEKLFGREKSAYPFARVRQAGFFEQTSGGTLVFYQIHLMEPDLQEKLVKVLSSNTFSHIDSDTQLAMQSRVIFISDHSLDYLRNTGKVLPDLLSLLENWHFHVIPLRQHKEDIPRLVSHYLGRFSKEFGKSIYQVSAETLGIFMNYDWPGNLSELASVIRRAVMLARGDEILPDQILLGLPKTEGKWEFNLLRLGWVRKFLTSKIFPRVPQVIIGFVFLIALLFLLFGPPAAVSNIGLTLAWYIGWPLMFFSFFFLARTWCSVCSLAVPGTILQYIIKPSRATPAFIKNYSGWIMATLCILVFWVEIIWNAYNSPWLTAGIIIVISSSSALFSVLFARRSWCRYVCPLGAVNAIFSMPSVVELRSNRHVCMNTCQNHSCYTGGDEHPGCPMFRHPYLVDNNRDCIMCAKCIKACGKSSIQLNVRLAPEELWGQEIPRRADSFLIVSMAAIFFPFALHHKFNLLVAWLTSRLAEGWGLAMPEQVTGSLLFFLLIAVFQAGFYVMVSCQSAYARMDKNLLLPLLGYGFIPLILGGFLSVHLEYFVSGAGRLLPNIQELLGLPASYENLRLISRDSTYVLQVITVMGGLLASLYATYRVILRGLDGDSLTTKALAIPFSFLIILASLFVFLVK